MLFRSVIMESIHFRTLQGLQVGASADGGEDMGAGAAALAALGAHLTDAPSVHTLSS